MVETIEKRIESQSTSENHTALSLIYDVLDNREYNDSRRLYLIKWILRDY